MDKEGFCTHWSWAGDPLIPFPGSKSNCSVINLCQQFQAVRMEIGDNKAEGKLQSSPSVILEPCFSLWASSKGDNERNHCGNYTVPEVFLLVGQSSCSQLH